MKASDNVAAMVWAFSDPGLREDVRKLAQEVRFLELNAEAVDKLYSAGHRALDELVQVGADAAIIAQLAAALGVAVPTGNAGGKGSP